MSPKWMLLAVMGVLAAAVPRVEAQTQGQFGAGVVLGSPTGGAIKYWIDSTKAFDAGVGFSGDTRVYADLLWHAWDLFPNPKQGRLGGYVAVGGQIDNEEDAEFGIRTMGGLDYWIADHPIEVFCEAGPAFNLDSDHEVDVNADLGVRFYFKGTGPAKK